MFHADGRTDMTKLIVAFRNFVNVPKINGPQIHTSQPEQRILRTNQTTDSTTQEPRSRYRQETTHLWLKCPGWFWGPNVLLFCGY
jgi:hypothetical protein